MGFAPGRPGWLMPNSVSAPMTRTTLSGGTSWLMLLLPGPSGGSAPYNRGVASKKSSHLVLALLVDLVLVLAFVVVGHYQHYRDFDVSALATTAWPFVGSLVLAWLLVRVWDRPLSPLATGTGVWAVMVLVGLTLRAISGVSVAEAFLIVATGLNFVTLVGWRLIASAAVGRSAR